MKASSETFATAEIAALLEVPIHEVDYWVKCRLIAASVQEASGHGSRRRFCRDDLQQALLVHRLRTADWKPRQIARAISAVKAALADPNLLHTPLLIHEGNSLLILCRDNRMSPVLLDAAMPGQYVMVIALDTLEEETRLSLMRSK